LQHPDVTKDVSMPLPASVPTGTVSGTWYTPSGNLATGEIIFLLTHEIEIPDDADGVVIPVRHKVAITAGQLTATLPSGFYNVLVRLAELYFEPKVVEIVTGQNLNLPDAIGVVPPEELLTPVRTVNGVLPDASGNIEVAGGSGAVSSVFGRTGAVVATSGDYTKAQVGLGNVDNTSDAAKPVSTATQTALDTKEATGTAAAAVAAHVALPDPHPQYALESSLTPWYDSAARRFGCKAITMHPLHLSPADPKYIAMSNQRLYQYFVGVPAGETITGIKLPIQDLAAGAGSLWFAVYNSDLTKLGETANVASSFTSGATQDWRTVPLTTPGVTTGNGVWIVALSTMDTGPQVVFCNTALASDLPWVLNPTGNLTAMRTESVTTLPTTLSPSGGLKYIDFVIGVY
jgi:hypothetical protein